MSHKLAYSSVLPISELLSCLTIEVVALLFLYPISSNYLIVDCSFIVFNWIITLMRQATWRGNMLDKVYHLDCTRWGMCVVQLCGLAKVAGRLHFSDPNTWPHGMTLIRVWGMLLCSILLHLSRSMVSNGGVTFCEIAMWNSDANHIYIMMIERLLVLALRRVCVPFPNPWVCNRVHRQILLTNYTDGVNQCRNKQQTPVWSECFDLFMALKFCEGTNRVLQGTNSSYDANPQNVSLQTRWISLPSILLVISFGVACLVCCEGDTYWHRSICPSFHDRSTC